jgi:hypothetical protein
LVEQLFKMQIQFNHGAQAEYGRFPIHETDPTALALLDSLSNAMRSGLFTPTDLDVIGKAKAIAGL